MGGRESDTDGGEGSGGASAIGLAFALGVPAALLTSYCYHKKKSTPTSLESDRDSVDQGVAKLSVSGGRRSVENCNTFVLNPMAGGEEQPASPFSSPIIMRTTAIATSNRQQGYSERGNAE